MKRFIYLLPHNNRFTYLLYGIKIYRFLSTKCFGNIATLQSAELCINKHKIIYLFYWNSEFLSHQNIKKEHFQQVFLIKGKFTYMRFYVVQWKSRFFGMTTFIVINFCIIIICMSYLHLMATENTYGACSWNWLERIDING